LFYRKKWGLALRVSFPTVCWYYFPSSFCVCRMLFKLENQCFGSSKCAYMVVLSIQCLKQIWSTNKMYVINYIHKYDALSRAYLHIKSIWNVIFNQQQDRCRKYLKNTKSVHQCISWFHGLQYLKLEKRNLTNISSNNGENKPWKQGKKRIRMQRLMKPWCTSMQKIEHPSTLFRQISSLTN
jgi:hypothetical protein